jgi:hypothetical protein
LHLLWQVDKAEVLADVRSIIAEQLGVDADTVSFYRLAMVTVAVVEQVLNVCVLS